MAKNNTRTAAVAEPVKETVSASPAVFCLNPAVYRADPAVCRVSPAVWGTTPAPVHTLRCVDETKRAVVLPVVLN